MHLCIYTLGSLHVDICLQLLLTVHGPQSVNPYVHLPAKSLKQRLRDLWVIAPARIQSFYRGALLSLFIFSGLV